MVQACFEPAHAFDASLDLTDEVLVGVWAEGSADARRESSYAAGSSYKRTGRSTCPTTLASSGQGHLMEDSDPSKYGLIDAITRTAFPGRTGFDRSPRHLHSGARPVERSPSGKGFARSTRKG